MRPERRFKGRNGKGRLHRRPKLKPRPRRTLAYCALKMVLTMGSTLPIEPFSVDPPPVSIARVRAVEHKSPTSIGANPIVIIENDETFQSLCAERSMGADDQRIHQ